MRVRELILSVTIFSGLNLWRLIGFVVTRSFI
jgi:hypothetical protein